MDNWTRRFALCPAISPRMSGCSRTIAALVPESTVAWDLNGRGQTRHIGVTLFLINNNHWCRNTYSSSRSSPNLVLVILIDSLHGFIIPLQELRSRRHWSPIRVHRVFIFAMFTHLTTSSEERDTLSLGVSSCATSTLFAFSRLTMVFAAETPGKCLVTVAYWTRVTSTKVKKAPQCLLGLGWWSASCSTSAARQSWASCRQQGAYSEIWRTLGGGSLPPICTNLLPARFQLCRPVVASLHPTISWHIEPPPWKSVESDWPNLSQTWLRPLLASPYTSTLWETAPLLVRSCSASLP